MARTKQKVAEKDYETLISKEKENIETLEEKIYKDKQQLKASKANLKKLEKDYENYKVQKSEEEKLQKANDLVDAILASGKDLDELKDLLLGKDKKETVENK